MKPFFALFFSFLLVLQSPIATQAKTSSEDSTTKKAIQKKPTLPPVNGIQEKIEAYIKEHEDTAASVAVSVFEKQKTIVSLHHGMTNITDNVKSNQDTVYEWGSVTKLLTWVSIMQLAEQGEINLTDDISDYLPDEFLTKLTYDKPINFLHLMNHQGGWQETTIDIETKNIDEIVSLKTALNRSEPPQIYEPGTTYAYSNWGCALAGFIVENISGMAFHEYVKQHIFLPLGMTHTSMDPTLADNKWVYQQRRQLNCYYIDEDNVEDYGTCIRHVLLYPAGMATGTLADMTMFAKALLPDTEGKSSLFKQAETLEQMITPSLFYGDSSQPRVSHGFLNTQYGVNTIGHPGNTAGCTANLVLDPASGRGAVVMANQVGEVTFNSGLMPLIFGSIQQEKGATLPPVDSLAGYYLSTRTFNVGMLRILRILGQGELLPLMKTDDSDTLSVALTDSEIRLIDSNRLDVLGLQMFVYEDEHGTTHLQNYSHDYVKQNTGLFLVQVGLILLIPVSVIYSLIALLVRLIVFIIRKRKKKENPPSRIDKLQLLVHLAIIAIGICFYQIIMADSYTVSTMWLPCSLSALFAIFPIGYAIAALANRNKLKPGRLHKINCVVTAIVGLLMTFNVIYWQTFYFWV